MKRFQFRLQQILDIRDYREQEREIELGRATGKVQLIKNNIAANSDTLSTPAPDISGRRDVLSELTARDVYRMRLRFEINDLQGRLETAEREREEAKQRYLEASKEKKILESLKERRQKQFYRDQLKEEVKEADDMATAKAARKAGQELELLQGVNDGSAN